MQLFQSSDLVFSNQSFKWAKLALIPLFAVLTLQLTGCATRDPNLDKTLSGLKITEVRVDVSKTIKTGKTSLEGMTPEQQVATVRETMQTRASEGFPKALNGARPVRLVLTLDQVSLASPKGRRLYSAFSVIRGKARLEDVKTGVVLVAKESFHGTDYEQPIGLTGLIGMTVRNAMHSVTQDVLTETVVAYFNGEVWKWLKG